MQGHNFGLLSVLHQPQYAVPFGGVEIANEWYRSPWFGMFKGTNNNWVFHPELGWIYHSNDQTNGVWIWIENFGWSWTGADLWPYFWVNDRADWIYYLGIHEDIPRFWTIHNNRLFAGKALTPPQKACGVCLLRFGDLAGVRPHRADPQKLSVYSSG